MFRTAIAAALATVSLSTTPVAAATILDGRSSFWVFGDSLSDSGNLFALTGGTFPPPPYFNGRFSNGPVWHEEYLVDFAPGASGSLAVGGSRAVSTNDTFGIPDLPEQVQIFVANKPLLTFGDRPLAAIFSGANDILGAAAAVTLGLVPEAQRELFLRSTALQVVASIEAAVNTLGSAGIDEFVLFNLPDLGATPRLGALGGATDGRDATIAFNTEFDAMVDRLRASKIVHTVDIFALFEDAVANPADYGLVELAKPCLPVDPFDILSGTPVPAACDDPDTFLYWDALHPTATGHAAIAAAFDQALPVIPLPAPAFLLLAGLGGLAMVRRRAA